MEKELETLRKLGLTEYESKLILSLLELGPSKVSEIAKQCNVPKNKIYESLQKLSRRGILEELPETPKKYLIKSLDSLNSLLKYKEEEINLIRSQLQELKNKKVRENFPSKELVWINYGHESFIKKIKEALQKTEKENLIVALRFKDDPVIFRLNKEAMKKGAKIKIILPEKERKKSDFWKKSGVQIRYSSKPITLPFSTFDDFLCRLNLNINDKVNDPTLWIESKPFIHFLKEKFNTLWKQAKP